MFFGDPQHENQQPQHENQQLSQVPGSDRNAQVGKPSVGRDSCVLEHDQNNTQYTDAQKGDSLNAATLIWNHIKSLCRNISA